MSTEAKLQKIEEILEELLQKIKASDWVTISEAAEYFAVHHSHIRNIIKKAQLNPKSSRIKYGVHYRQIGSKYQCNLKELEKAFNSQPI